jgi:cytochrome P450
MGRYLLSHPKHPEHVPAELFWDHSLVEFSSELDDPYVAVSRLHDGPDIIWARDVGFGRSGWILTRYALQEEVFSDASRFSSEGVMGLNEMLGVPWPMIPIEIDPPRQTLYRQALNPLFSPRVVNDLENDVRATCDSLIADFKSPDRCDYVADFTIKFPTYVFLAFMGLPREMAPQFLEWDHTLWRSEDVSERTACARAILRYLESFVEQQRSKPSSKFMQGLLAAGIEGRPLSTEEILGVSYLVYTAGLDTVYSSLGWHMRHLAADPVLQERLRTRPADIPRAVNEFLRAFCVVAGARMVTKDMDFHGVSMRKGDLICLPTHLAARDPAVFNNPHVIDIDRQTRVLAFGTGHHTCIGMHLARREIKIVLESMLSRFRNIRIPEGESYRYHAGPAVVGIDYLPLTWETV